MYVHIAIHSDFRFSTKPTTVIHNRLWMAGPTGQPVPAWHSSGTHARGSKVGERIDLLIVALCLVLALGTVAYALLSARRSAEEGGSLLSRADPVLIGSALAVAAAAVAIAVTR